MSYSVALTKTGQMTLPKSLRTFLGVDGAKRVTLEQKGNAVVIKRRLSDEEFLAKLDNVMGEEVRLKAKRAGNKGVSELLDEYYTSSAGRRELKDKYDA